MEVTIVYDNEVGKEELEAGWGFSSDAGFTVIVASKTSGSR